MSSAVKDILAMMDLTKPVNNLSELGCMTSFSVTRKTWRVLGAGTGA